MKKYLLFLCLSVIGLCTTAQTSIETAADLVMGLNSYDFGQTGSNNTAYFKYKAPAEEGQLLTINTENTSTSVSVSEDGTYATAISNITLNNGSKRIYPIKKGQTVYVEASTYNGTTVSFNAETEACDVEAGSSCNYPVESSTDKDFFVPSYYNRQTYEQKPTYISYTADEAGILSMAFSSYVSAVTIQKGCDATPESLSFNYDSSTGGYSGKYAVESGITYILSISTYSPLLGTFTLSHPTEGASCDLPFATTIGSPNILPAASGKYWYQLVPEQSGFVALSSESGLPGGTVKAYGSCSDYSPKASVNGMLLMRVAVQAGQSTYFCIEKTESTASETQFNLAFEEAGAGDSFDKPMSLHEGKNTTPTYNGTYYYSLTLPEGQAKMINVDASKAGLISSSTQMSLYSASNPYTPLASGTATLSYEGQLGSTYILVWNLNEGSNAFDFNVSLTDIEPGDVASNPIQAHVGENQLDEATVKYYTYTATQNGWLSIDAEPNITVTFPRDVQGYSYYDAQQTGTITRIQATSGTAYLIKFEGMVDATSFILSEEDYQEGESKDTPIALTEEVTTLPTAAMDRWYLYTATQNGRLTVSSNISYENAGSKTSKISVQINDGYPQNITTYGGQEGGETYFQGRFNVVEGDKVYINVVTLSAQKDRTITCTISDLQPGEAASNPLPLTVGEIIVPEASRSNPIWYATDLSAGEFSVTGLTENDYFSATLYRSDDLQTAVARSSSSFDPETNKMSYFLNYTYEGVEKATFLLCFDQTNTGGATVNVTGDNLSTDITSVTSSTEQLIVSNGRVIAPAGQSIHIYDLSGRTVFDGQATKGVALSKGVYIVNGKKIIVR